ncbi:carboxylesterase 6 [Tripterygium wilfordii]|uniref:Carboxylesterase 6 n=1 Tax=Tripterygium wilfordii TaxID=458696 RepID=A0A7J7DFY6_TRIWF|nr:probable carboxylesterase 6 [Tripterygium wilfordii]KAF5745280.1 carboxylesterase 6 [Tripterygium wilfordii]
MATVALDPSPRVQIGRDQHQHGPVIEEIEGLIKVYKDGHVERPQIIPCVTTALPPKLNVTSGDVLLDIFTNTWSRFYVPTSFQPNKLPLMVYFHGGGFCIGSAAWSCYHDFLARLSAKAGCVIMSVDYRLAPENPLPTAYEDGIKALMWLKQQILCRSGEWWSRQCDLSRVFVAGDSAGANIAHNVVTRLGSCESRALNLKGTILIQPFFGGETRTQSEKCSAQSTRSALSLGASDTYWRLALPRGSNRDHPWCNPMVTKLEELKVLPTMVCISEMDILKDRNLELYGAWRRAGKKVECVVYKGVGHAFQILNKSQLSQIRSQEMMSHIKTFVSGL